jgi:hypothetical protein
MWSPADIVLRQKLRCIEYWPCFVAPGVVSDRSYVGDKPTPYLTSSIGSLLQYDKSKPLLLNTFYFLLLQPDNPGEFVSKVYEMMAVALDARRKQRQEDLEKFGRAKAPEAPAAEKAKAEKASDESVVEASQVLTEEDPWKQ